MNATFWGIFGIGLIIGWLVYSAVRRTKNFGIKTIGVVIVWRHRRTGQSAIFSVIHPTG